MKAFIHSTMSQSNSIECHSIEQLEILRDISINSNLGVREALFLTTQLVNHGHRGAFELISELRRDLGEGYAGSYLDRLESRLFAISELPDFYSSFENPDLVKSLYATSGYCFREGTFRREIVIVIFTTKFNNFHVSNLVMDCLLAQWGVSRLFLKDVSPWMYFKGVKGLSEDLHTLPAALDNLIAAFGCTGKILTGFSSGGYASLFCALQLKDAAYVGFSTYTNIERSSNLPMVKMFETIRHELPVSDFQDLRKLAVEEPLTRPFYFYFGERDATDRAHAIHMDGLKNIKISKLADVHHDVPGAMIEQRLMSDAFRSVIEHFSAEKLNESE